MLSNVSRAFASMQWLSRRGLLLLLVVGVVSYGLLFHDVHGIIVASSAALKSYQGEGGITDSSGGVHFVDDKATGKGEPSGKSKTKVEVPVKVDETKEDDEIDEEKAEEEKKVELGKGDIEVEEEKVEVDSGVLPPDLVPVDEYLAICLTVKNQGPDMVEWLVHHYHHHGIKRFYIMDDGSVPPLSTFDYPGIPRSALTFTYQPRDRRVLRMQMMFYKWCLQRYRDRHTWMAFIDADEFFEVTGNETMKEILQSFENDEKVGALGVNWKTHTSNGLLTRPESVRKAFTECVVDHGKGPQGTVNRHIKSIVKMQKGVRPVGNPHKFVLKGGAKTVGENGDEVTTIAFRPVMTRNRIALHHYAVKSKAEYKEKTERGSGQTNYKDGRFWDEIENQTGHEPCDEMVHYDP